MKKEISYQVTGQEDGLCVENILRRELRLTGHQIRVPLPQDMCRVIEGLTGDKMILEEVSI